MRAEGSAPLEGRIRARDGAVCVYAEKNWIAHARMSVASLTDTHLNLTFRNLSSPGFTLLDAAWDAGVALSGFRFSSDYWMGSPYLAWIIAFDPHAVSMLIATARAVESQPDDQRAFVLRGHLGALMWPEFTAGGR